MRSSNLSSVFVSAAGAKLSALHGVLRQQTQRQEADLALSPVQRRAGHQLLQEQVSVLVWSGQMSGVSAERQVSGVSVAPTGERC